MRRKVEPLLCELHAHTRWSDGALPLTELVDLYGTNGFDVLAVTDHVIRPHDGLPFGVHAGNRADYFAEIAAQAERARRDYDLLALPGLELTYDDADPFESAHTVAVGIRDLVRLDAGLEPALVRARGGRRAHRRPSVPPPCRRRRARPSDAAVLAGLARARPPRRSLGALQPPRALRVGRGARPAGGRERRLPQARAPLRLEDAAPVREARGRGGRVPPLGPARIPDPDRPRAVAPRSVSPPNEPCRGGPVRPAA
jgi:hypothetical protein